MSSLKSVHESENLLQNLIQEKNFMLITNKRVLSKTVSNDLILQNCFESLSGLEDVVAKINCTTQVELALDKMLHLIV